MKRSAAAIAEARSPSLQLAVGDLELRLLREAPVGIARLELLEVLDRLRPVLARHGVLRLAVEALRRPADGFVVLLARTSPQPARTSTTSGSDEGKQVNFDRMGGKNYSVGEDADWEESFAAPMRCTVPSELGGLRLDQALARLFPQYSRSRLQAWLKAGHITVDGRGAEARQAVTGGEQVVLEPPPCRTRPRRRRSACRSRSCTRMPTLIVIDKPAGWSCIPAPASRTARCSTRCSRTRRSSPACRAPASCTGSTRTRAACWWSRRRSRRRPTLVRQLADRSMRRVYLAWCRATRRRAARSTRRSAATRARARAWRSRIAASRRAPPIACSSASAARRWSSAASRPAARTRSACTSSTSAIRWSAIRSTAAARATALAFPAPGAARRRAHAASIRARGQTMTWRAPLPRDMKRLLEELQRP